MRHCIRLMAAICCALAGLHSAPAHARRVALVIGNADYKVGPLQNPVNDAAAVAEAFDKQLKFDKVILKHNLGVEGFRAALLEMSRESAGADLGVIYFAGHGTEFSGRNFLIPVDAALAKAGGLELEAISLDAVLSQLDGVRTLKLVILDACRNNVFPLAGAKRTVSRGLARIEPEDNTVVAYAAKEGTTADDGAGRRHSPFTEALLKHIATPGLEIRFILGRVRDEVMATTHPVQQPHVYASLGGKEFYLQPRMPFPAVPVPTPAVRPPLSEAAETARICREVEAMSSLATLSVLDRQHKGKSAGECIAARIEELRRQQQQVALSVPPQVPGVQKLNAENETKFSLMLDTEVIGRTQTYSGETTDLNGCARRCLAERSCQAFSFNVGLRFCYLIDDVVSRSKDSSFVSAIVRSPLAKADDARVGELPTKQVVAPVPPYPLETAKSEFSSLLHDTEAIGRTQTYSGETTDLNGCARRCLAERSCQAFSFNVGLRFCYLIDQVTSYDKNSGFISATVLRRR